MLCLPEKPLSSSSSFSCYPGNAPYPWVTPSASLLTLLGCFSCPSICPICAHPTPVTLGWCFFSLLCHALHEVRIMSQLITVMFTASFTTCYSENTGKNTLLNSGMKWERGFQMCFIRIAWRNLVEIQVFGLYPKKFQLTNLEYLEVCVFNKNFLRFL